MCWWSSLPFSLFLMEDASRRYGGVIVRRVGLWQGGKVGKESKRRGGGEDEKGEGKGEMEEQRAVQET